MTIEYDYGPSGNCPVQADGKINGFPFYFRSRGQYWTLKISSQVDVSPFKDENALYHSEKYNGVNSKPDDETDLYSAGWAEPDECKEFIERAAKVLLPDPL